MTTPAQRKTMRDMFDEQIAEQIVERVWQGKSLRASARELGTNHNTFLTWLDRAPNSPICDQYARAIAARADVHADRIEDVVDKIESGELKPDQGRAMADQLKWIASKLNPKRYGDRIQADVDMTVRVTVDDPTLRTVPALPHGE